MQTVRVSEKAGSDGILRLQITVDRPNAEYEAVVVLQPAPVGHSRSATQAPGWPQGYFEETYGSITDETFVRPPQGELPGISESGTPV